MSRTRRPTGSLEAEVLAALWRSGSATPRQLQHQLDEPVSYSTVTTILTRLRRKGLIERRPQERGFTYRPVLTEAELAARRMQAQLDRAADREAALMRFIDALPARDERALRRILRSLEEGS